MKRIMKTGIDEKLNSQSSIGGWMIKKPRKENGVVPEYNVPICDMKDEVTDSEVIPAHVNE